MTTEARATPAQVRARFPEFTEQAHPDAVVVAAIGTASRLTAGNGDILLAATAHLLALRVENTGAPDGGSGVVAQETVGPRMVMYEAEARGDGDAFWLRTAYGRLFKALDRTSPRRAISAAVY